MSSPWPRVKLGEVTVNHDGRRIPVREADRKSGPHPYYGASGVVDHVDGYLFEGLHLLIAEDGENLRTRQTPIAFLADGRFWVNNHAHIVTGNDRADTRFLCYALAVTEISGYLTGSAMPKLTQRAMNAIEVPLPPIDTQRAIAETLGSLDDKIEQNRRTGAKLEGLAQGVFKAWFVDFEPVKAKAAGATAFPGMPPETFAALPTRLTDSPLGPVPQGWEVKPAIDVVTVAIGKTPPRKEPQWFSTDPSNIPWASISDMGSCGVFIRNTSEYLTAEAVDRFNVRRIPSSSVLFSFKLTIGRVAITDGEITSNEAIAHFVPASPDVIGAEFLYCYLSAFDHAQLGSTSSIATATNSKAIKAMPVLVPDIVTARSFTIAVRPFFDLIRSQSCESRRLAALRDDLLPRLLSGRVRVGVTNG